MLIASQPISTDAPDCNWQSEQLRPHKWTSPEQDGLIRMKYFHFSYRAQGREQGAKSATIHLNRRLSPSEESRD